MSARSPELASIRMDYFQLLKTDGRWWIVSKLFHADPQDEPSNEFDG